MSRWLLVGRDHPGPYKVHAEEHGDGEHHHDDRPAHRRPPRRPAPELLATTHANVMPVMVMGRGYYGFRRCQLPSLCHAGSAIEWREALFFAILRWNISWVQLTNCGGISRGIPGQETGACQGLVALPGIELEAFARRERRRQSRRAGVARRNPERSEGPDW